LRAKSIKDYLASLDEPTTKDSQILIEMMQRISGHEPKLLNAGTLGLQLSDVELPILEQIVQQSYEYIKAKAQGGPIDRILWQTP
jgi:hypothetical protein